MELFKGCLDALKDLVIVQHAAPGLTLLSQHLVPQSLVLQGQLQHSRLNKRNVQISQTLAFHSYIHLDTLTDNHKTKTTIALISLKNMYENMFTV